MFHHPYGWLEPQNAREFKVFVEERSDLVLTGYEHVSDAYIKIRPNGDADTFLEGRAMWDTRETETGLNVVLVDGEAKLGRSCGFLYAGRRYSCPEQSAWAPLLRNRKIVERGFESSPEFDRELGDIGTGTPLGTAYSAI